MNLEKYRREMLPAIEEEMQAIVEISGGPETSELRAMLRYHLGWEGKDAGIKAYGKRIRPQLVLLTTAALKGDWTKALPAAASVELLHNFSLIHDDIQDNSKRRRGRPTLWTKWGIPQAINAGDAMFSLSHLALEGLIELASADIYAKCAKQLPMSGLQLTQGQYMDLAYEKREFIQVDEYWPMVGGKTAALLSTCTTFGAICANASSEQIQAFAQFGERIGLAFQVHDDVLGIWGNENNTGKSAHNDLLNGKKSLPVIYGLAKKGKFSDLWKEGNFDPDKVIRLADLLEKDGAKSFAEEKGKSLTKEALQALDLALANQSTGGALRDLAIELVERTF